MDGVERKRDRRKEGPERVGGGGGSEEIQDEHQVNGKDRMLSGGMIRQKEKIQEKNRSTAEGVDASSFH